jgi:hypothetical protein
MRNLVVAIALVFSVPTVSASDMSGRLFPQERQAGSARTFAVVEPAVQPTRLTRLPALREATDIPIIPLPKSLRPTRPPAGSPL